MPDGGSTVTIIHGKVHRGPAEKRADPDGDGYDSNGVPVPKEGETQDQFLKRVHDYTQHKVDNIGPRVPGLSTVEDLIRALGNPQTWVRVGEVLAGAILLIIGLDHMFDMGIEANIGKAAPFLV